MSLILLIHLNMWKGKKKTDQKWKLRMHNQTFQKECEEMKGCHPFSISYGKLKYSLPPHYTTKNVEYCYKKINKNEHHAVTANTSSPFYPCVWIKSLRLNGIMSEHLFSSGFLLIHHTAKIQRVLKSRFPLECLNSWNTLQGCRWWWIVFGPVHYLFAV